MAAVDEKLRPVAFGVVHGLMRDSDISLSRCQTFAAKRAGVTTPGLGTMVLNGSV
jgi:hypothetical protein